MKQQARMLIMFTLFMTVVIFGMAMVNNAHAEERIVIRAESPFGMVSAQTKCLDGYLFSIIRNSSQLTASQVYRPGTEDDDYRPQPVTCKR